jgi:DNA-binding transcriptional MerR regulator
MQLALFDIVQKPTLQKKVVRVREENLTKIYYTITEVADMFQVNASMLRFWEKEFPTQLSQIKKNKKGDRYYNKQNIETLQTILYLTKEKRLTLEGAREFLKHSKRKPQNEADVLQHLETIKTFLVHLKHTITKHENN